MSAKRRLCVLACFKKADRFRKRDEDLAGGHLGGYRPNNAVKLRLGRMKRKRKMSSVESRMKAEW